MENWLPNYHGIGLTHLTAQQPRQRLDRWSAALLATQNVWLKRRFLHHRVDLVAQPTVFASASLISVIPSLAATPRLRPSGEGGEQSG